MEIVECPVCLEVFQNPKILPTCFHTLCGGCAESLILNKTINCPLCRTKNAISKELAPNYIVQQLLDSKKINVVPKPKVFCESEDGNVATIWCEKCDYCYCEECWSKIHAVGKFKTHSKQPVEDKQREKNNKIPMCLSHQNYTCDFYCKTCSSVICNICWVDSHKHPHEVFSIYNCSEEVRKNLLETVTTNFSNETNATNNNVTDHRNRIKKNEELIAQKRAEIENLSQEIVGFQKVLDYQLQVLEQSKANQELIKELIQQQMSATLLDPNAFSQLESQISEIFSSLFKKNLVPGNTFAEQPETKVEEVAADTDAAPVDGTVSEKDIDLVLQQVAEATREQAAAALRRNKGDIVDAIMVLNSFLYFFVIFYLKCTTGTHPIISALK